VQFNTGSRNPYHIHSRHPYIAKEFLAKIRSQAKPKTITTAVIGIAVAQ
jgi:hypothetical protein